MPLRDVEMMEARLAGADFSLNAQQAGEEGREWVETLEDDAPQAAEIVTRAADLDRARDWLAEALAALNARERMIIVERKLRDEPRTLESLGQELGLSKERIRQLEAQALASSAGGSKAPPGRRRRCSPQPDKPDMTRLPLAMVWLALLGAGLRAEPSAVAEVIAAARDADIVVIGEVHDNPEHHRVQAEIVTALQPGALVFEMLPQANEDAVNRLRAEAASRDEIAAALDWEASGWPDFGFYAVDPGSGAGRRIFGGGKAAEEVRRAVVEGGRRGHGLDALS